MLRTLAQTFTSSAHCASSRYRRSPTLSRSPTKRSKTTRRLSSPASSVILFCMTFPPCPLWARHRLQSASSIRSLSVGLFRRSMARASPFMVPATGSMRSVSSLCFLESLMSPKLFTTSTAFARHQRVRGLYSRMSLRASSRSRKPLTAMFCPAQLWAISTQMSGFARSSCMAIARSVALWPSYPMATTCQPCSCSPALIQLST